MAQLDFDTLLLLDSFGTLREQVNTGDQIFVNSGQLSKLYILLDRNQLSYESASYPGLHKTMLTLHKNSS